MKPLIFKPLLLLLFSLPYILFLRYMYSTGSAPVDYLTFTEIGQSLLEGTFAYQVNVYYPLPTVVVFAILAWLPEWLGLALWFVLPVLLALWMLEWDPLVLLYAPLLSHFLGGQASVFGLIGLWAVLYHRDSWKGGSLLALSLLKPQLALIPLAYAAVGWARAWCQSRRLPAQLLAFAATAAVLAAPAFVIYPGWLPDWLGNLRPLFPRALAGLIPRLLLDTFSPLQPEFWLVLGMVALAILALLYLLNKKRMPLELAVLWSFIASPLVHDYDLIQLVPLLRHKIVRTAAPLISIPGWYVLVARYADDRAWFVFALIAPVMAAAWLFASRGDRLS
ncbi:MAG: hypothetical protein KIS88_06475 [Anaerolineales bacterium]|nr:hypothetical protein [Anaerolineales bacterium]